MWRPASPPSTESRDWRDEPADRDASVRRAARRWPLLPADRRGDSTAEDEVYELLRDAVDARDRFPQLWSAATEDGAVGGRALRQLVRQHRDKPRAESLRIDADQAAVLRSEPVCGTPCSEPAGSSAGCTTAG